MLMLTQDFELSTQRLWIKVKIDYSAKKHNTILTCKNTHGI